MVSQAILTQQQIDHSQTKLARSYINLAMTYHRQGQITEAINHLEQALQLSANLPVIEVGQIYYNLGLLWVKQGDLLKAMSNFENTLKIVPDFIEAKYQAQTIIKGYKFTQDWFSRNIRIWQTYLNNYINQPIHVLEIGSWEGRSTCWLIDHILTHPQAHITCIDTFAGSYEMQNMSDNYVKTIEDNFDFNIYTTGKKNQVTKIADYSYNALRSLPFHHYDLIYIDGSHLAIDVLEDTILSWRLLKPEGIIIFDDYDWDLAPEPNQNTKVAIAAFFNIFAPKIQLIHQSHQVLIKKTQE